MILTHSFGKSEVSYNPESGEFIWIECCRKPWRNGQIATSRNKNGYLYVKADGKLHSASRLAWKIVTGNAVPDHLEIDHINRVRGDNRIVNLRVVDRAGNMDNVTLRPGQTGVPHVSVYKRWNLDGTEYTKYRVRGKKFDKDTIYFDNLESASRYVESWYAKLAEEDCLE